MTQFLASSALAVAGSLALAGPRVEWLSPTVFNDSASSRQSLHYTPVSAKDCLTPVSAEVRTVCRVPIRARRSGAQAPADIARDNAARSLPRPQVHPADDSRSPANTNYRN